MTEPATSEPAPRPVPTSILVVYAHPDDESFGPAAVLARYARAGSRVHGLFFTPGQHGQTSVQPPPSPEELGRLRVQDLRAAAKVIGFSGLDVLDFEDGALDQVPDAVLEAKVREAIRRAQPQVVITFGPGGMTGHPDHRAVHRATLLAFRDALARGLGVLELYYDAVPPNLARGMGVNGLPDGEPNTWIDIVGLESVQIAALRFHARHVVDAAEMVQRLEHEPRAYATFFRAWPAVLPGKQVRYFLEGQRPC